MKLYLITLTLSLIALFIFIKRTYKYASVQDTVEAPIDYESTQAYKDNEPWFTGMGRCWMIEKYKNVSDYLNSYINEIEDVKKLEDLFEYLIKYYIVAEREWIIEDSAVYPLYGEPTDIDAEMNRLLKEVNEIIDKANELLMEYKEWSYSWHY